MCKRGISIPDKASKPNWTCHQSASSPQPVHLGISSTVPSYRSNKITRTWDSATCFDRDEELNTQRKKETKYTQGICSPRRILDIFLSQVEPRVQVGLQVEFRSSIRISKEPHKKNQNRLSTRISNLVRDSLINS
ncbi:uncharacterized protein LOC144615932 isoform X2 [Panthera onca]